MKPVLRYLAILILFLLGVARVPTALSESLTAGDDALNTAHRVVELTNQERAKLGLLPLKWNDALSIAGTVHAQDMAIRNYFAHNTPEGVTPVDRARRAGYPAYGWGGLYVGENLAKGFPTAEGAMGGWLASPGHKENLLNPKYREIGVGVVTAANGTRMIAQEFGCEPKLLPVFINGDAPSTRSVQVTLSITAEDVSSWGSVDAIASIMVSNRSDFAGASWQPHVRSLPWTLIGTPGVQKVYVRFRDVNGITTESSDDIVYEGPAVPTSTPMPTATPQPTPTVIPTATPTVVPTASPAVRPSPTSSPTAGPDLASMQGEGLDGPVLELEQSDPSSLPDMALSDTAETTEQTDAVGEDAVVVDNPEESEPPPPDEEDDSVLSSE